MDYPKVINTVPANEQTDVSPNLSVLEINFNKPMSNGFAFISSYEELNYRNGYWKDRNTFCIKIISSLKPGKEYIIYLNSPDKLFFKDTDGKPLLPTTLIFKTKKS